MTEPTIKYPREAWPLFGGPEAVPAAGRKGHIIYVPTSMQATASSRIVRPRDDGKGYRADDLAAYRLYVHLWLGPEPAGLASHPIGELLRFANLRSRCVLDSALVRLGDDLGLINYHRRPDAVVILVPDMLAVNIVSTKQATFVLELANKCGDIGPADRVRALVLGTTSTSTSTSTSTTTSAEEEKAAALSAWIEEITGTAPAGKALTLLHGALRGNPSREDVEGVYAFRVDEASKSNGKIDYANPYGILYMLNSDNWQVKLSSWEQVKQAEANKPIDDIDDAEAYVRVHGSIPNGWELQDSGSLVKLGYHR